MRILIVTPLYPPDIADHASYVKELATRLSVHHEVTVLAYNHIPEQVSNVTIIPIEKSARLLVRLSRFTRALVKRARKADIIYVQNGPSVEFPISLVSHFLRTPFYLRLGDDRPLTLAQTNHTLLALLTHTARRAHGIITHTDSSMLVKKITEKLSEKRIHAVIRPLPRPEILPFVPYPTNAFKKYEESWKEHIQELFTVFAS